MGKDTKPTLWLPENKDKSSTPYELRFKILQLARDHLVEEYHIGMQALPETGGKQVNPNVKFPTWGDIKKLAALMREFVDNKGSSGDTVQ